MSDGPSGSRGKVISDEVRSAIVAAAMAVGETRPEIKPEIKKETPGNADLTEEADYDAFMQAQAEALNELSKQVIAAGPKSHDSMDSTLARVEARLAVAEQSLAALEQKMGDGLKGASVETDTLSEQFHGLRQRLEKFEGKQLHALAEIRLDVHNLSQGKVKQASPIRDYGDADILEKVAELEVQEDADAKVFPPRLSYLENARIAAISAETQRNHSPVYQRSPIELFWQKQRWAVLSLAAVLVVWFDVYVFAHYQPAYGTVAEDTAITAAARAHIIAKQNVARGLKYLNGAGVPVDLAKARLWIGEAARAGDPVAENLMGVFYQTGTAVAADMPEAIAWYEKAARHGNLKATANLGKLYAGGWQDGTDFAKAAQWFAKAAAMGDVDAAFNLAVLHERGLGVKKDLAEAYRWYGIAAKRGDDNANERLAQLGAKLSHRERTRLDQAIEGFVPVKLDAAANAQPHTAG